ncbi:MAG TPA: transglutaminase-like domain-containing protein, partial [Methanofastidiosum sp.]|nr:transglutaminase-like domain-containing protein [Methanofastidiosum sp.]
NNLSEEEKSLLEIQNKLNQEVFSYNVYESKDPRDFVDINDSLVLETLNQIITPNMGNAEKARAIFNYTRDEISKDEKLIRNGRIDYWNYPKNIINSKKGQYEDKIILLISMLRSAGFKENEAEVVGAKISLLDSTSSDIWVELKLNGNTYLLLPRENNNFDSFTKDTIYKMYSVQELYRFNDKTLMRS